MVVDGLHDVGHTLDAPRVRLGLVVKVALIEDVQAVDVAAVQRRLGRGGMSLGSG